MSVKLPFWTLFGRFASRGRFWTEKREKDKVSKTMFSWAWNGRFGHFLADLPSEAVFTRKTWKRWGVKTCVFLSVKWPLWALFGRFALQRPFCLKNIQDKRFQKMRFHKCETVLPGTFWPLASGDVDYFFVYRPRNIVKDISTQSEPARNTQKQTPTQPTNLNKRSKQPMNLWKGSAAWGGSRLNPPPLDLVKLAAAC